MENRSHWTFIWIVSFFCALLPACSRPDISVREALAVADSLKLSDSEHSDQVLDELYLRYAWMSNPEKIQFSLLYSRRYLRNNEFFEAGKHLYKAYELIKDAKDKTLLPDIYNRLALVSWRQGDLDKGLEFYRLAEDYYRSKGTTEEVSGSLLAQSWIYRKKFDIPMALHFDSLALELATDPQSKGRIWMDMGNNFSKVRQHDKAIECFSQGLQYPIPEEELPTVYQYLGWVYKDIQQWDSATYYFRKAFDMSNSIYLSEGMAYQLQNLAILRGDSAETNKYHTLHGAFLDSIGKLSNQPSAVEVEKILQVETVRRKGNKHIVYLVSGSLPFLAALFFILYRLRRKQRYAHIQSIRYKAAMEKHKTTLEKQSDEMKLKSILLRIESIEAKYAGERKALSPADREQLNIRILKEALPIDDEKEFSCLINRSFPGFILSLQATHPTLSWKEIVWCCLSLIELSRPDTLRLMDMTPASLSKFQTRLAKKMEFSSVYVLREQIQKIAFQEK